jgi:hypothetical protein
LFFSFVIGFCSDLSVVVFRSVVLKTGGGGSPVLAPLEVVLVLLC